MKVQRVAINIPYNKNTHKKYLANEVMDFMSRSKDHVWGGGTFSNESIKLNSVSDNFISLLNKAKIFFEKVEK